MRKLFTTFSILSALALSCFAHNESLLIGPGDLIHVQVIDTPELEQKVRVSDAGTVSLAFVGDLKIAGETPAAAARVVETALINKDVMRHPQVTLSVEQYATQNVSVLGQVHSPGAYPIATPQSILKVLSLAGGLTDLADRNITIERHGDPGNRVKYYLSNNGDQALSKDVLVYPGDSIVISKVGLVYILGDVARPGGYPIATNDSKLTVLQAIAMAGSTNKTSLASHARLIRRTVQGQHDVPLQVAAIENGKQADVALAGCGKRGRGSYRIKHRDVQMF